MVQEKKTISSLPILGITLGDTNGVGPEILAKALANPFWRNLCVPVVFGDIGVLQAAGAHLHGMPEVYEIGDLSEIKGGRSVPVCQAGCTAPLLNPGTLDPKASHCASIWIESAAKLACKGLIDGMVTCPVCKEGMLLAGCPYPGHTPMLQAISGVDHCHMSLFSDRLRIVHITAHLSMHDAIVAVQKDTVLRAIEAGENALRRLGFVQPRIAVAGLNPHAGESGAFGQEEQEEIAPAVVLAQEQSLACSGPYSPDTVFHRMYHNEFDLVVAMYHDQGHIPFKLMVMDEGVHVTLGLPFIRTSPDHGTAYDIAGTGHAREQSLCAAITLAAKWARQG